MALTKKKCSNKCWQGGRENETFPQCWWECKMMQPLWKGWQFFKMLKTVIWLSNSTPKHTAKRNKNTHSHKNWYTNAHKNEKVLRTHCPSTKCLDNEISRDYKGEWSTDTCYSIDELENITVSKKKKKPVQRDHMYYSIHVKYGE
jgi:hypothetical protein